jgi:hypothetical protein
VQAADLHLGFGDRAQQRDPLAAQRFAAATCSGSEIV